MHELGPYGADKVLSHKTSVREHFSASIKSVPSPEDFFSAHTSTPDEWLDAETEEEEKEEEKEKIEQRAQRARWKYSHDGNARFKV